MNKPAILGGSPLFSKKLHIVQPVLPKMHDLEGDIRQIIDSGIVTKGPYLKQFENKVARHLHAVDAVGTSSATIGLMLVYQALALKGDVIVPSFTFMATVSAMVWANLRPIFVEVEKDTSNIDVAAVEAAITPNTSAIVAVHTFGAPCDLKGLSRIAQKHNLRLIIDAAHAFGTLYNDDSVARYADAHVYSLSPTKLVIASEGGIVATNDQGLADKLRISREYGNNGAYDSVVAGLNGRLSEMHAMIASHSLDNLEPAVVWRNSIASLFTKRLSDLPGISFQTVSPGSRSSYKDYSIVIDRDAFGLSRDKLSKALAAENIDTRNYYDPPVHRQAAYTRYYQGNPLPVTDMLAQCSISLPIWSHMPEEVAEKICSAIYRIHQYAEAIANQ